ncbi:ammonium transporter [Indioceanicola profundi]|uniref:ammonium transporter n=1 Tax=Indioceanicola profundi TaxID=2220096 RepID=UPI000E6AB2A9|nr:ammonium transporter [Indioceanicola profundi]
MPTEPVVLLWILTATGLVFLMQVGFCLLEIGFVRPKNTINVAIKNVMDFCLAGFMFWLGGYALMFGPSIAGLVGWGGFMPDHSWPTGLLAFVLFQMVFCGTAATIVSGAVAERMGYSSYIAVTALLSGLIYPIFGHWAWGGLAGMESAGWLGSLGFIDFAGSTVVHSVGGWMALAACLVIGPRLGRFEPDGRALSGSNLAIAAAGVLILWLGWIGFNGGSVMSDLGRAPGVILNTMVAACSGGLAAQILSVSIWGRTRVEHFLNGILAGLVAITACATVVATLEAALVGAIGGLIALRGQELLEWLRIDDAVGAVPVHLFAGIWGTLAVAILGDPALFGTGLDRWDQLRVQFIGVASCGLLAFGGGYALLLLLNCLHPLRISVEAERMGLNVSEHDAYSPMLALAAEMERHRLGGRFDRHVHVEPESDVQLIAAQYNRVIDRVAEDHKRQEKLLDELSRAKLEAEASAQAKSRFLATMSHELRTPLNAVIGFSHLIADEAYGRIDERYVEHARDIHDGGRHLLDLVNDVLDFSRIEAGRYQLQEQQVDVGRLLYSVQRMLQNLADSAGVAMSVVPRSDLPALMADERVLRQIMINLVGNAVKFTPPGGHIRVAAVKEPDRRICLIVADTGIGMDPKQVPKALEPFTQLESGHAKGKQGTGLGLSLVRALVTLHGGTLVIQTSPGQGTTVHVRFPADRTMDEIPVIDAAAV